MLAASASAVLSLAACGPAVGIDDTDGETGSGSVGTSTTNPNPTTPSTSSTTTSPPVTVTSSPPTTADSSGESDPSGSGSTGDIPGCTDGDCKIDIVVVIDNSSGTAGAQEALAQGMIELESQLRTLGADFQIMFTTTDFGNLRCTQFKPDGYTPARGRPIATACTERISDFTGLGSVPQNAQTACTNVCPEPVGPIGDPFVASNGFDENVPELIDPVDIDGDGEPETTVARALACLTPQGINGCGFESPLENLLQALNPGAEWNTRERPFIRDDAALGIVLLTDELDCSVSDAAMMNNTSLMELSPATGMPALSSALCWNAGTDCEGPADDGTYDCTPNDDSNLHPIDRYQSYLQDFLVREMDKSVYMLGILGVPAVTDRLAQAPFTPTAGGILDLEIRDWQDADVLPEEAASGTTAADKQFALGVGPSCSRPESTTRQQAVPPLRIAAVCDSLSGAARQQCCIESICDDDYAAGMRCLVGMFQVGG